jgi:phage antirepressor YoqD-like protein
MQPTNQLTIIDRKPVVTLKDGVPMADSRAIAYGFAVDHSNLCETLRKHLSPGLKRDLARTPSGQQQTFYWLTEKQVLMLPAICKSSPELIEFQELLVDAFLELRATSQTKPPTHLETARNLVAALERAESAEQALAIAAPIVTAHKALTQADGCVSWSDLAKILHTTNNPCGRTRLLNWLREIRVLMPDSTEPYQIYIDRGWFVRREVMRPRASSSTGNRIVDVVTLTTQKGVVGIQKMWVGN